ncbi:MAG TPA: DUF4259 domain-containing protein [Planctomycetota bacterium]|nr:DUF4259 domain-containing protein [Planctomycetota bacterium]
MGSWGYEVFENDSNLDWARTFARRPSLAAVEKALDRALAAQDIDDRCSAGVLVSCELLAALAGQPSAALPQELATWVGALSRPNARLVKALVKKARAALVRVGDGSEVQESWEDAGNVAAWRASLKALDDRLHGGPSKRAPPVDDRFWACGDDTKTPPAGTTFVVPVQEEPGWFFACRVLRAATERDLQDPDDGAKGSRAARAEAAKTCVVVGITAWFGREPLKDASEPLLREILHPAYNSDPDWRAVVVFAGSPSAAFTKVGVLRATPAELKLTGVSAVASPFGWGLASLLAAGHLRAARKLRKVAPKRRR